MQKSQLKPGTVYAIKRSTYSREEPGLLLRAETWHSHTERELGRHEFAGFKMGPAHGYFSRYSKPAEGNPVLRLRRSAEHPVTLEQELSMLQKVAEVALTRKIVGGKNVERFFGFEGFKGEFFIELRPSRQFQMTWDEHVEEEASIAKSRAEAQQRRSDRATEVKALVEQLEQLTGEKAQIAYGMTARFSREGVLGGASIDMENGKISGMSLTALVKLARNDIE